MVLVEKLGSAFHEQKSATLLIRCCQCYDLTHSTYYTAPAFTPDCI